MATYLFSKWVTQRVATGQIGRRLAVTRPEKIISITTRALFYPLLTQIDVMGMTVGIPYAAGVIFSDPFAVEVVAIFQIVSGVTIYFGGTLISLCAIIAWIARDYQNNNLRVWSFHRKYQLIEL